MSMSIEQEIGKFLGKLGSTVRASKDFGKVDFVKSTESWTKLFDSIKSLKGIIDNCIEDEKADIVDFVHYCLLIPVIEKFVEGFEYRGKNEICALHEGNLLKETVCLILTFLKEHQNDETLAVFLKLVRALHNYTCISAYEGHKTKIDLPIVVWPVINACKTFPTVFECCSCEKSEEITLSYDEIINLRHGTTAQNLVKMMSNSGIQFTGKRQSSEKEKKDICPQGLVYFGIDLDQHKDRQKRNRYALENRYGSVVVLVTLTDIIPGNKRFMRLGTKKYSYEYSQQIIAQNDFEDEWWVIDDLSKTVHLAKGSNIKEWKLLYCNVNCKRWINPEIVIPGSFKVDLAKVKIRFEIGHSCIVTTTNGKPDGRRVNCIECEIKTNQGICYGKIDNVLERIRFVDECDSAERSMKLFALDCPLEMREYLKTQNKMFEENQFFIILKWWEKHPNQVSEWSLNKVGDENTSECSPSKKMKT